MFNILYRRVLNGSRPFACGALFIAGLAMAWPLPPVALAQAPIVQPVPPAPSSQAPPARVQDPHTVEIASKTGVHFFSVELAANDEQRARGLMDRKELPEGKGMLFDFHREQEVAFWMKNTYIPLDMIFITGSGRIHRIHENAEPLSERPVPSGGPVRAVLEVYGGTARKLGIAVGDRVGHPIFGSR